MTGAAAPSLTPVGKASIEVAAPMDLGSTPAGHRRMIPILGGTITGTLGPGEVLAGGADWQMVHSDGAVFIDATYLVQLPGGVATFYSRGVRSAPAAASEQYFRVALRIVAPASQDHLNQRLFLATGLRESTRVLLDIFEVG
jgi:hypothetical protein